MMIADEYLVFVCASTLMALGIGIDAALATFVRSSQFENNGQAFYWMTGVVITHTVFPMAGYLLAYASVQQVPWLAPVVGIFAFMLVAHFLYTQLLQTNEDDIHHSSWITIGLILAVSWDALWSGPAKSAQVLDWSQWMIWLSFLWVGAVVCLLCVASLYLGRRWLLNLKENPRVLPVILWLQFSVIGYFGWLALFRYTFNWQLSELLIFCLSGVMVYLIQIRQKQSQQAAWQVLN